MIIRDISLMYGCVLMSLLCFASELVELIKHVQRQQFLKFLQATNTTLQLKIFSLNFSNVSFAL